MPSQLKKLLVADTKTRADYLAMKLELDPDKWHWCGLGDALAGRGFSGVVGVCVGPIGEKELKYLLEYLPSKVVRSRSIDFA